MPVSGDESNAHEGLCLLEPLMRVALPNEERCFNHERLCCRASGKLGRYIG